jgi:hypothetical protein
MRWFSALRHPRSSLSQSVENTTVWACDRKRGLHRAYLMATAEYARTVEVLTNRMGALTSDEYDLLRQSWKMPATGRNMLVMCSIGIS